MVLAVTGTAGYCYDRWFNASAITRSVRCVYNLMYIAIDYKLNFDKSKDIDALHARSAERLYRLLVTNKGLYIKMGQAIAIQAGVFPPVFQELFGQLFDAAPQDSWAAVSKLMVEELGRPPEEVFAYIDRRAVASASIAQVYRARLKTGEWVAVKLQHADIRKQVSWDLAAYRGVMWVYERLFNMPVYFIAQSVSRQMELEVVFSQEVANGEELAAHIEADKSLRGRVYVPKVYKDLSTDRVIVSEWIDGLGMNQMDELRRRGYDTNGAVDLVLNVFAKQMFSWGLVHSDPHPGNLMLRRVGGRQQLVIIDHGLYVRETERFRRQYVQLWRGMFRLDRELIKQVATEWGFGDSELFASAMQLQPVRNANTGKLEDTGMPADIDFERQEEMRQRMRHFLQDSTKIPLELIFLGRTMRILQGVNQMYGSPVNRVKVFGLTAVKASSEFNVRLSLTGRLRSAASYLVFRFTLLLSDVAFYIIRLRQFLFSNAAGLEDIFEQQVTETIETIQ